MQNVIAISQASSKYRDEVIQLLQSEKLPVVDLPRDISNFYIATDNGSVIGAIGLEIYEHTGLLRSLVVNPEYRNLKIAEQLVEELENMSKSLGLISIYLLTETAQKYFAGKGYETINRSEAPESIKQSSEFAHVCPASAVLMYKLLS